MVERLLLLALVSGLVLPVLPIAWNWLFRKLGLPSWAWWGFQNFIKLAERESEAKGG